jgi:thiol-disulfide isomerase/thioredoxin
MKLSKKQWINAAFIVGISLILFTPVGFYGRVFLGRLLASSAAVLKTELQISIKDYNWQLVDVDNGPYNFEEAKGEVVLLNFWATWCAPCVAEMPSLQNLYNDYGEKVTFLFVAQDKKQKVSTFIEKHGYNLPIYFSNTKAPGLLTAKTIPTTYVIDKQGEIIVVETGVSDWNSNEIRNLLDDLVAE